MTDIPETWQVVKLGWLAALFNGDRGKNYPSREELVGAGIPFINAGHLVNGSIDFSSMNYITDEKFKTLGGGKIQPSDILYCLRGSLGKAALVGDTHQGAIASSLVIVRAGEPVRPRFLYYYLISPLGREAILEFDNGSAQPNLSAASVKDYSVPLAPLNEQKRIADKLDVLLGRADACRERLGRVPLLLKRFRQSVLAAAVSGKLTEDWREGQRSPISAKELAQSVKRAHEIAGGHKRGNAAGPTDGVHDLTVSLFPSGWELLEMRELVRPDKPITYGILKPGPDLGDGIPYIRVADYPNNCLNVVGVRKTSPVIDNEFARSRLSPGDLLLSIRGTVGRIIEIPTQLAGANITQDSARLSIQDIISRAYVRWFLQSDMAQTRMKRAEKGVAVRGINIGDVRALQVPIPPFKEQVEIVRRVEVLFRLADDVEAGINSARRGAQQLVPSLLAKAFRGELFPQDSADEPASELLARINEPGTKKPAVKKEVGKVLARR